jgi:hypothetical protein
MNIQIVDWRVAIADFRDCGLGIEKGDWRLGLSIFSIDDWRLAQIHNRQSQSPSPIDNPNQQSPISILTPQSPKSAFANPHSAISEPVPAST